MANETLNIQNGVSPITIDTEVTEGSMRPVTSDGIFKAIQAGGGDVAPIETTHSALKALRDVGTLKAGAVYRITDYVTKVRGYYDLSALGASGYLHYATSAEHPFDILVVADDESTLNENAHAIQHEGDTYFANSDLAAWELKYSIDNDPTRFAWADPVNGKGVIFYMKDEFNNSAGYDFKNMLMPRYALAMADPNDDPGDLVYDASTQPNRYGSLMQIYTALLSYMQGETYVNPWKGGYDFAVGANILGVTTFAELNAAYMTAFNADLYYTFDFYDGNGHTDHSLNSNSLSCYENEIKSTPDGLASMRGSSMIPFGINGSVWENLPAENAVLCNGNYMADSTLENTFGSSASGNRLETASYGNTFGDYCDFNTFGDSCNSNTFGKSCDYNTFGKSCDYNTFGGYCGSNTFGGSCYSNTFGDYCDSNTFGEYDQNNELQGYIRSTTLGKDIQYISVSGGASGTPAEYYHICDHVRGTSGSHLSIVCTPLLTYETYVGYNSSGVLKTWCPADHV